VYRINERLRRFDIGTMNRGQLPVLTAQPRCFVLYVFK